MPNPYFKFKQFTVFHDKCAMKVGTDGVLIGIWTDITNVSAILDIGTGTGLIALILAQKTGCNATIEAIDIDENAVLQAKENIERSGFRNISSSHYSLQEYARICNKKFDLIVSNPPYFTSSLQSPDKQRTLARHTDTLSIEDFINISAMLLSDTGRISLVFPHSEMNSVINTATHAELFTSRITHVYPTPTSLPKRVLLEFSKTEKNTVTDNLTIELGRHIYSPEFIKLAKDFYLKM